jgi:hypothetical protein
MRFCRLSILFVFAALIGCEEHKSYMRDPIVRQLKVIAGPVSEPERATPAEPYPPVRPVLPDDPSSVVVAPMVQSPQRTPAPQ